MLPPGHLAGGLLAAEALLKITHPALSSAQHSQLLWWGMVFGFAPDLDNFAAFLKIKAWWYKPGVDSTIHRRYLSHAPLLWLVAGLLVYLFSADIYWKEVGLLLWLGSWTHFFLDSIEYGVMWLWPFNKKIWALKNRGKEYKINADSFFGFWLNWVKFYIASWTFYTEIVIVLLALIIYFK